MNRAACLSVILLGLALLGGEIFVAPRPIAHQILTGDRTVDYNRDGVIDGRDVAAYTARVTAPIGDTHAGARYTAEAIAVARQHPDAAAFIANRRAGLVSWAVRLITFPVRTVGAVAMSQGGHQPNALSANSGTPSTARHSPGPRTPGCGAANSSG